MRFLPWKNFFPPSGKNLPTLISGQIETLETVNGSDNLIRMSRMTVVTAQSLYIGAGVGNGEDVSFET